jgi:acetyl esterase/lipase
VAVVVLIPGGGWVEADRSGLVPLAEDLAARGTVAVTATYRTAADGVRFPTPVEDVVCAVDFAAARAAADGFVDGPVVVAGHSAGAHLAALAALQGGRFRADCPHPAVEPDALVGLAGPYDVSLVPDVAWALFGSPPGEDAAQWAEGNPFTWVESPTPARVYLAHGEDDRLVPPELTRTFAAALEDAGHRVDVDVIDGADHQNLYAPEVIGARLATWIASLSEA